MTKSQMKFVAESYAQYFGRAADADTNKVYGLKENGKAEKKSVILENIIADADVEKGQIDPADFVNNAFQNLFGRDATTKDINKYSKVIEKGENLPINSIVKSAAKTDKAVYNNKMAVAVKYAELGGKGDLDLSKISKGNTVDLNFLNTVTKAADLKAKIETLADNSGIPSSFDGKTFVLTEGVDAGKDFTGTNKGDLFIADATSKITASAADTLDGGKGVDTFKVYDATGPTVGLKTLPTLKNIENVVIYDNKTAALNLTKWDTVEKLFLVNSVTTAGAGNGITLGEKVSTVNFEDIATITNAQVVNFDNALTAATLGLNKVTVNGAATNTITVNGTALKTLTVDASGKASNVALVNTAIETLNITGKANLTLDATHTSITSVKTVDGSKAEGNLTFSNTLAMTSIKTGSGNDTVTVAALVDSGETINLGAGNDKLLKGAGTIAAGSIIDGGAGIDSLDSALVTVGNAGVFVNFETLSLTTAIATAGAALDMDLLKNSTITSIAKDAGANVHFVKNVQKSQSLTINTNATAATTLVFKDVAGTADAYTINFDKETTGATVDANVVTIEGIETVTVNSLGKTSAATDTNKITLKDTAAKSLVITGDKNIELVLGTAANEFGSATAATDTNGLGVSTIDASASTAGITIATGELVKINTAWSGLTIKGGAGVDSITTGATTAKALTIETGAGNDTIILTGATTATEKIIVNAGAGDDDITVGATGGTFTLGTGKDKIDASAAAITAAGPGITAATSVFTTITDIEKGDVIEGLSSVLFAKADISTANSLDTALNKAANIGNVTWFQYDGNTYIVDAATTASSGTLATGDLVVKLNGIVNLGNSTISSGDLTIA